MPALGRIFLAVSSSKKARETNSTASDFDSIPRPTELRTRDSLVAASAVLRAPAGVEFLTAGQCSALITSRRFRRRS